MRTELLRRIIPRLLADFEFKQSSDRQWLNQGRCPECNKRELFTHADAPWLIKCGRLNNCGLELQLKSLYPDEFGNLNKKYTATPRNPSATADAYLSLIRGLDIKQLAGCYTQESFAHPRGKTSTATVRFTIADGVFMERFVEPVDIIENGETTTRRANFSGAYKGKWWQPPNMPLNDGDEVWLVEGCIDALTLKSVGIKAVAILSCVNFPEDELLKHKSKTIKWIWALDSDSAGRNYTRKHIKQAQLIGIKNNSAAQTGCEHKDWNDVFLAKRLQIADIERYKYNGKLLIAKSALDKALLINQKTEQTFFVFDFNNRLYAFSIDYEKYQKAFEAIKARDEHSLLSNKEIREQAIKNIGGLEQIANAHPRFLYFQVNKVTDESWYFMRLELPTGGNVNNTFTGAQIASAAEFNKRLLSISPGIGFSGKNNHLQYYVANNAVNIRVVNTIDFLGYTREHGAYIFNNVAFKDGVAYEVNNEEFFELPKNKMLKSLYKTNDLQIEKTAKNYISNWGDIVWDAYGAKGMVAAAFWFGSLFAEQIRGVQQSFPFLEIVGEASSGKTTLVEFLWRLFGRNNEGFDPNKGTRAGIDRALAQYSNMPCVFIEADRDEQSHARKFDWEEMKPYYNGSGMRVRGVRNSGNETYEPPFRGTIAVVQNAPVIASEAIMQRIVHLNFTLADHNFATKQAAGKLNKLEIENLSYFLRLALAREHEVIKHFVENMETWQNIIMQQEGAKRERLAKNHAQIICAWQALAHVLNISDERVNIVIEYIKKLMLERELAIGADTPIVTEFWEVYEYLTNATIDCNSLNHNNEPDKFISINLNQFVKAAVSYNQQLPPLRDLKIALKNSRTYKFVAQEVIASKVLGGLNKSSKAVRVWTFKKTDREN